jgi:DNA polymerase alpha subunit A
MLARATNPTANPYIKAKAPAAGDEDDFMASLFENLDDKPVIQRPATSFQSLPQKRKQVDLRERERDGDKKNSKVKMEEEDLGGMGDIDFDNYGDDMGDETMAAMVDMEDNLIKSTAIIEKDDDDDDVFVKPALPLASTSKPKPRRQVVNGVTSKASETLEASTAKLEPIHFESAPLTPTPVASTSSIVKTKPRGLDWRTATESLAISIPLLEAEAHDLEDEEDPLPPPQFMALKSKARKGPAKPIIVPQVNALEDDGSLRFWWYESYDIAKDGTVYLTGKVQEKDGAKKWVSAMLIVGGIRRKVYVLPREKTLDGITFLLAFVIRINTDYGVTR